MNIKDTTEPTLSQYQAYNGEWCDFLDEQHYLDTVAEGKCRVRSLYASPQPVTAPACRMLTIEESGAAASSQDWDYDEVTTQIKKFCEVNNLNLKLPATEQPIIAPVCRSDGRCQYAIDHSAEDLGHCPAGRCCMPAQPVIAPDDEFNLRGILAASLKCWHRLAADEAAQLIKFVGNLVQPNKPTQHSAELLERLAAAEADAARYRWLRDAAVEVPTQGPDLAMWSDDCGDSIRGQAADEAIDAARAQEAT